MWYNIALFVHLMGLAALFSGFAVYHRAGARLRAATRNDAALDALGLLESSNPMFAAGTILLLVSGMFMMMTRWRAPHPWAVVGLLGLLTIWVVGASVARRHSRAIRAALAVGGASVSAEQAKVITDSRRWTVISALNGLAAAVMLMMTLKAGWLASVAIALIGAALGAVIAQGSLRGAAAATARQPAAQS